jgi:hypothetical protein
VKTIVHLRTVADADIVDSVLRDVHLIEGSRTGVDATKSLVSPDSSMYYQGMTIDVQWLRLGLAWLRRA